MSHVMITLAYAPALGSFSKLMIVRELLCQGWKRHTLDTYSKNFEHEMNRAPIAAMVAKEVKRASGSNSVTYTLQIGDSPVIIVTLSGTIILCNS
jgi:hypothetical protein